MAKEIRVKIDDPKSGRLLEQSTYGLFHLGLRLFARPKTEDINFNDTYITATVEDVTLEILKEGGLLKYLKTLLAIVADDQEKERLRKTELKLKKQINGK